MSLTLASIHIYPIKSLGGFEVSEAKLTDRGLEHDRRWMLVDEEGMFISQREVPALACLHTSPNGVGIEVTDVRNEEQIIIPWKIDHGDRSRAQVWSDKITLLHYAEADEWFSDRLNSRIRLMHLPDSTKRRTDGRYASSLNSLSDGFPYLIASQASLDDLNERLLNEGKQPVGMERFRPNLVIAGGEAFQEDQWREISIGTVPFSLVKPCARCVIVTIDQTTGALGKEPLRTLATYRSRRNKIYFAMNAVARGEGVLSVGDPITIHQE